MGRDGGKVLSRAYDLAQAGQRAAADPNASVFVTANAGSGKTKVLIDRVARLLLAGGAPSAFLCITYTKAAAAEMQRRLFERLGGWCVLDDEKLSEELAALVGQPADVNLARARSLFARALETPGGLRIQTIHAFCERLLKRFPLEAGVPPGFEIADDTQGALLVVAAWAQTAKNEADSLAHFAERLHDQRLKDLLSTIAHQRAPFTALAKQPGGIGAARAKLRKRHGAKIDRAAYERDFAAKIPWLMMDGAAGFLATSTINDKKCAARMAAARLSAQVDDYLAIFVKEDGEPYANVITAAARAAGHGALFDAERARVIAADAALKAIDRAADVNALLTLADGLLTAYTNAKRAIGALDFDDLIDRAHGLLSRATATPWVLYKLDGGIEHVLIDEGQDTSPRQWDLVAPLQAEFFSGAGARLTPRTVFAVGDPKQSIYSFQGADPERFLKESQSLAKRAHGADVKFVAPQLAMSFRSTQQVLDAVDAAIEGQPLMSGPAAMEIVRHVAWRDKEPGVVEYWPICPRPKRDEPHPWDAPLDLESGATAPGVLADKVAALVSGWIASGHTIYDKGRLRAMHAGDVLVLVRKRGPVFNEMLRALKTAGLDVAGADRMHLNEEMAVCDLMALARVALDPGDDLSLAEALKGPFIGLDEDALLTLAHGRGKGERLIDRLRAAPTHTRATEYIEDVIASRALPPYNFLARILETPDSQRMSGWRRMFARLGFPARDPVEELLARAQAIGDRGAPSLNHLLAAIEADDTPVKREMEASAYAARVMTVHGAKGLEAPVVILADTTGKFDEADTTGLMIADGEIFFSPRRAADDTVTETARRDLSEARYREHVRLLYVAMTRARDRLLVCGPQFGNAKTGRAGGKWGIDENPALTWHELVEQGLQRAGAVPFETEWGEGLRLGEYPPTMTPSAPPLAAGDLPTWTHKVAASEGATLRPLAPSQLGQDEAPGFAARPQSRNRFRRGKFIHGLLERLPEIAPKDREKSALAWLGSRNVDAQEAAALTREALGVLNDPAFAAVFTQSSRAEAPVVGVLPDGRRIAGVIDRLVISADEILALDFKTDRPAPDDPARIPESYVSQMAAYAAVLSDALPERPVRCAILWTEAPKLMEIPAERLARALAALRLG
jgi:ATP-dependent helicase/nuclease subunit A